MREVLRISSRTDWLSRGNAGERLCHRFDSARTLPHGINPNHDSHDYDFRIRNRNRASSNDAGFTFQRQSSMSMVIRMVDGSGLVRAGRLAPLAGERIALVLLGHRSRQHCSRYRCTLHCIYIRILSPQLYEGLVDDRLILHRAHPLTNHVDLLASCMHTEPHGDGREIPGPNLKLGYRRGNRRDFPRPAEMRHFEVPRMVVLCSPWTKPGVTGELSLAGAGIAGRTERWGLVFRVWTI